MRQFESIEAITVPSFTRDGTFQTVTLTGLNPATKLVTVQIIAGGSASTVGVRPTGTAFADLVFEFDVTGFSHHSVILPINGSDQLDFSASTAVATFLIIGEWGGNGVVALPDLVQATGWTAKPDGNSETWRDLDLTSVISDHDPNLVGEVAAVICFMCSGSGPDTGNPSLADARGNGSSWVGVTPPTVVAPTDISRPIDTVAPVDKDNLIEVYEGDSNAKGGSPPQNSFVYFVGFILRGGYDDGTGTHYRYRPILDPVDVSFTATGWTTFSIPDKTSSTAIGVYEKMSWESTVSLIIIGARNVGSSNAAVFQLQNRNYVTAWPLDLDVNGDVENFTDTISADLHRWIFGFQCPEAN